MTYDVHYGDKQVIRVPADSPWAAKAEAQKHGITRESIIKVKKVKR